MQVFIASSSKAKPWMKTIATWLPRGTAIPWDKPALFEAEQAIWDQLQKVAQTVDGAIFVFAEDDRLAVAGKRQYATRDNVVLELGLFVGSLGVENVRRVIVGKPTVPSDLKGVRHISIPSGSKTSVEKARIHDARSEIETWAKALPPVYMKGLGFDLFRYLASRQGQSVEEILGGASRLYRNHPKLTEIRAVCADKGKHGKPYYADQFAWVLKKPKARTLKRVFVRRRDKRHRTGFPPGEIDGILAHLQQKSPNIEVKWVFDNDPWLGGGYRDSLGFALFGKSWVAHWGMQFGTMYEHWDNRPVQDFGVGDLLGRRFQELWEHAASFSDPLIHRLNAIRSRTRRR